MEMDERRGKPLQSDSNFAGTCSELAQHRGLAAVEACSYCYSGGHCLQHLAGAPTSSSSSCSMSFIVPCYISQALFAHILLP